MKSKPIERVFLEEVYGPKPTQEQWALWAQGERYKRKFRTSVRVAEHTTGRRLTSKNWEGRTACHCERRVGVQQSRRGRRTGGVSAVEASWFGYPGGGMVGV